MRAYIASKYISHKKINEEISCALRKNGIDTFLPQSINVDAVLPEQMRDVSEICFHALEICNIVLVVSPFGQSVSCDLGYAIALKKKGEDKHILIYDCSEKEHRWRNEAMIVPYVEARFDDLNKVIEYCKSL